jgi:O-antigen ligase
VLLAFVVMVLLGGGGARHDIASLIYLRPLTFAFMAYAVSVIRSDDIRRLPLPFYLLLALTALVALQLVPLPPGIWGSLPQRSLYLGIGADAGMSELWRPLTLAPARTWNTLFSLGVPITAFLLYAIQPAQQRLRLIYVFIAAAAASVALGLGQLVAGPDSLFYLYRITNVGAPVGLFANRNHEGVFLAGSIVLSALAVRRLSSQDKGAGFKMVLLLGFIILLIPFVLILGSRAALLLTAAALLVAPWFIFASPIVREGLVRLGSRGPRRSWSVDPKILAWVLYGLLVAAVASLALLNARDEAFLRMTESVNNPMARAEVFPYLVRMMRDFMPWGSGFGSFDTVFKHYEPVRFLSDFYLNQAHDDWLQVLIEGGAPAAVLLVAFLVWIAQQVVDMLKHLRQAGVFMRLAPLTVLTMFAVASAVDYPARTPICMVMTSFVICLLADVARPIEWERK